MTENKLKVFVAYHKENYVFESDVFQPILNGKALNYRDAKMPGDNTGDNISEENAHYGELTSHYWVWKNYLPIAREEYVGFCHYRRFPDFEHHTAKQKFARFGYFLVVFKRWKKIDLYEKIKGYDIIAAGYSDLGEETVISQFEDYVKGSDVKMHMDTAAKIIKEKYPDYNNSIERVFNSHKCCHCLQFIMKKELLNEYFEWMFDILDELDNITDNWVGYEGRYSRMPAFLAERLINVWFDYKVNKENKSILFLNTYNLINRTELPPVRFINNIRTAINVNRWF